MLIAIDETRLEHVACRVAQERTAAAARVAAAAAERRRAARDARDPAGHPGRVLGVFASPRFLFLARAFCRLLPSPPHPALCTVVSYLNPYSAPYECTDEKHY